MSYVLTEDFVACVAVLFFFFFSLPLIFYRVGFSLLTASFSHFLTADIKCSCCFSNKIAPLCFFISHSCSFSVIYVMS